MKLQKVGEVSTKKRGTAANKLNNKKSNTDKARQREKVCVSLIKKPLLKFI